MSSPESAPWRFVTSHTQVLLCLQRNPRARLRDIAETVGITERATQRIVSDRVEAGYVSREREGRLSKTIPDHPRETRSRAAARRPG